METPRRNRLDLYTPAEKAIHDAMQEVEKAGADVKLTEAVMLLQKAKDCVADYVDANIISKVRTPLQSVLQKNIAQNKISGATVAPDSAFEFKELKDPFL